MAAAGLGEPLVELPFIGRGLQVQGMACLHGHACPAIPVQSTWYACPVCLPGPLLAPSRITQPWASSSRCPTRSARHLPALSQRRLSSAAWRPPAPWSPAVSPAGEGPAHGRHGIRVPPLHELHPEGAHRRVPPQLRLSRLLHRLVAHGTPRAWLPSACPSGAREAVLPVIADHCPLPLPRCPRTACACVLRRTGAFLYSGVDEARYPAAEGEDYGRRPRKRVMPDLQLTVFPIILEPHIAKRTLEISYDRVLVTVAVVDPRTHYQLRWCCSSWRAARPQQQQLTAYRGRLSTAAATPVPGSPMGNRRQATVSKA